MSFRNIHKKGGGIGGRVIYIFGFDLFVKRRCRKRNIFASNKKELNVVQRYDTTLVIRGDSK